TVTLDTFVTVTSKKDAGSSNGDKGTGGVVTATDSTLPSTGPASRAAAAAAAVSGSVARKRSSAATAASGSAGRTATAGGAAPDPLFTAAPAGRRSLPAGLVTAELLGLTPYTGTQGGVDGGDDEDLAEADPRVVPATTAGGTAARAPRRAPPAVVTSDPVVLELLSEAEAGSHAGLGELLREHTFVGVADGSLALLQHGTRLYLVDVGLLSRDMCYQLALRRWEQPLRLSLDPPPLVSELVALGLELLEVKGEWQPGDGSPEELGQLVSELLQQNRPELERQIGLVVDPQGRLLAVPQLLEGLHPDPARLPDLVLALAKDVDWEEPKERARAIAEALADMYAARPPLLPEDDEDEEKGDEEGDGGGRHGASAGIMVKQEIKEEPQEEGVGVLTAGALGGRRDAPKEGSDASPSSSGRDGAGQEDASERSPGSRGEGREGGGEAVGRSRGDGRAGGKGRRGERERVREQLLAAYEYQVKNVVLPALRGCLKPPVARASDGSCVQVAALERLYRIFERC
ncbi:hypothetical protein Agub_g52, partial [Astrephomene gubernaculifera]